jgi:ferric-chelate reductase
MTGGTGNAIVSSFSSSLIVVAGSGVTFALATIRDLIKNGTRGSSRVRILELVWVVQDSRECGPF